MFKKIGFTVLSVALGTFLVSQLSFGQSTTSTTTLKQTSTTTPATKAPAAKKKAAAAPSVETTETTSVTTPAADRPVYNQETLKKMNNTLCAKGFDAKVGNDNKNVCSGKATAPDLAYSCVWTKKGEAAFAPTLQGPCNLDSAEHRGSVMIEKADYKSAPPLPFGTKVECCYRAAKGPSTTSTSAATTVSPKK